MPRSCLWSLPEPNLRIIGVDPGLVNTGYGVIDVAGGDPVVVEGGVIRTKSSDPLERRLHEIFTSITGVLDQHRPACMAIEDLHSNPRFAKTAILMGHARGVLVLAAGAAGIPVFDYAPTRAKNVVTGSGRAPKEQVMLAVAAHLREPAVTKNEHVADAFAIALCHAIMSSSPAYAAVGAAT